ncbi:retropepsin-like aspartic protease [Oscillatoria sp. FACHB-1406]|uniref:retropepsin-like aspartic protease family protein n=1 Tax=Oscillatoria sp. FACHB-1406 TaxID=2692846 RepID=UPI001684720A|nr:retropepsin-like aspartic protease [Oscillatoria sp. FACHB-1406]MBD2577723.1 retroviral-like aspartic protease family protein [Oscillatoria sp. FACHB-1406]
MLSQFLRRSTLVLFSTALVTSNLACQQGDAESSAPPSPTPAPQTVKASPAASKAVTASPTAPKAIKASPVPTPDSSLLLSGRDPYNEAVELASSAINFSKTAMVTEDWVMIASRWQQAVNYLQAVPQSHGKYKEAKSKLPQYQRFLSEAQLKAKPSEQVKADAGGDINPKFFLVPIEERIAGIPLIKVKFNGREFDMLFDTGASKTLVSGEIAGTLNLKPVSSTQVGIADGSVVELPIVVLNSVEINGRVMHKVSAAVAPNMPFGLLGQDFFEGYDFTIKQNAIEFHRQ